MEPEYEYEWETTVTRIYAEAVGEADDGETIDKKAAMKVAQARLARMVEDGDLKPDPEDVIHRALLNADANQGKRADKLVKEMAEGNQPMVEVEENLNTVVILGKGQRKLWRYVREEDLLLMDELRFKNLQNAQESYTEWRPNFEVSRRKLRVHVMVQDAYADEMRHYGDGEA